MEILTEESINPAFKRVKYGVRGWLEGRSYEIQQELARGAEKPFSEVLIHYGNPQGMGQPPITFFRQVLALLLCPDLQNDERFPQDAKRRAKRILDDMIGHTVGSYTATQGINVVREDIANFISQRDGHPAVADDIYLTDGGAEGLEVMLGIVQIESHEETGRAGVMIPVPGFSMYQARLLQHNSYQIFYPLDEDNNWALNMATLERVLEKARPHCVPRALVLINPGNPTGQVLTYENVQEIVRFCAREKLVLFADEVYQANIHVDGVEFHSCKKVLRDMGAEYSNFQLISLHSGAKGYAGECGLRGGYIELVGFSEQVKARIKMYLSARSCSSTIGQVIMGLICNPPRPGDESYDRFSKEKETVLKSHKKKAKLATEVLNSMEGVKCNEVRGAVYAFPRITLPKKAIEEAKTKGLPPDEFYCWKALEKTGSYFVPGHGFDMNGSNNHYYFRTSRVLSLLAAILPMNPRMLSSLTLAASHDVSAVILHNVVTCSAVMHLERYKNKTVNQL